MKPATDVETLLALIPFVSSQTGGEVDDICEQLGLSRPQLHRLLNQLIYYGIPDPMDLNLLLAFTERGKLYCHMPRGLEPIPPPLTYQEGMAFLMNSALLLQLPGFPQKGKVRKLRKKLMGHFSKVLGTGMKVIEKALVYDFGSLEAEIVETLVKSIVKRQRVKMTYHTGYRDSVSQKKIDPYRLMWHWGHLFLLAVDRVASDELRTYAVERILSAQLTSTRFTAEDRFLCEARLRTDPYFEGKVDAVVEIWLAKEVAEEAKLLLQAWATFKRARGGALQARVPCYDVRDVCRVVLRFGRQAKVLSPQKARQAMKEMIQKEIDRLR